MAAACAALCAAHGGWQRSVALESVGVRRNVPEKSSRPERRPRAVGRKQRQKPQGAGVGRAGGGSAALTGAQGPARRSTASDHRHLRGDPGSAGRAADGGPAVECHAGQLRDLLERAGLLLVLPVHPAACCPPELQLPSALASTSSSPRLPRASAAPLRTPALRASRLHRAGTATRARDSSPLAAAPPSPSLPPATSAVLPTASAV